VEHREQIGEHLSQLERKRGQMRLIEIFYSIQGEGPAMGRPATFVRLAGCNLSCQGCDTDLKPGQEVSLPDVLKSIQGKRVVITGGEPTLQMGELTELISLLHSNGMEIHIETNGTNPIPEAILEKIHYAVVSPKRGSNFHLAFWAGKENVHLKFVLGKAPWCWTSGLLEYLVPAVAKERVWIMAYGTDQDMKGAREAWDLAMLLCVNYSDRLHIRLKKR
jgi:7-carboxy-7-deazaguanine synthase